MNMERELSEALGRTEPPEGFGSRVLERIQQENHSRRSRSIGGWRKAAAVVLLLLSAGVLSSVYFNDIRNDALGEHASTQLVMAMRIASEKTNLARAEIVSPGAESVDYEGEER